MANKKYIGLRAKMLMVVALCLTLIFTYLFFVARYVLLDGYDRLEKDKSLIQVGSAVHLLQEQSLQLEGVVSDWAHWDDTYAYFLQPNPEYIKSNVHDDTFRHLKINAIFLINLEGDVILERGFDYVSGQPWLPPAQLKKIFAKNGALADLTKENISGLLWTPEGVSIVSAFAVRKSGGGGQRLGTFMMVRQLNSAFVKHIEEVVDASVTIERLNNDKAIKGLVFDANQVAVHPLDENKVAGYALLTDLGSHSKLILRTLSNRNIFEQGQSALGFLFWTMSLIALMLAGITWLFDRLVLLRLARMNDDVKQIELSASITARIRKLTGNDELASLSHSINDMLERLEDSQYELQLEKDRAKVTLEGIADAVITSNPAGYVLYMNPAAERLTGIDFSEVQSKKLQTLFRLMSEDKVTPVDSLWLTDPYSSQEDVILERADGKDFVIRKSASPLFDQEGHTFGIVTVLHDVTMLRTLSSQLSYQARHDPLTGLINRYEFDRKAQAAIDDTAMGSRSHCIAYVDLDKFKIVNDTCGHMAGDVLLKQLSNHLKAKVRNSDTLARIGGDEFALLLMGCNLEHAQEIVDDLLNAVREYRFIFEGKVFKVGASIGLTEISPEHTQTLSELLSTVDSACYAAKEAGGDRLNVYHSDGKHMKEYNNQLKWVSRIQLGLEQQQFILYMQRMESLTVGAEAHCELLIRMQGLDGTLYPPGFFLPAAERYHLMPKIDRWVIREAFSIISRKGPNFNCVCAINLSGQTLSEEGFLDYVVDLIKQFGVNTRHICFEITETSVISNLNKAREFMRTLRELGCRFSLDDFGSGLSSFAYLKSLQVDFLKIDGMFVKSIVSNKIDRAMVESINNVGHVMGLHTIAEFAENDEVISILREIGVDYAQGYGVARPELFDSV